MKHILIIFFGLTFSVVSNAQLQTGDFVTTFNKKLPINKPSSFNKELYGIELEYLATDWLGLNYTVYANEGVFHMPGGFVAGLGILAIVSGAAGGANAKIDSEILYYAFAIPEGVSFNVQMAKKVYLSPYINPLGLEYVYGKDSEGTEFEGNFFMTGTAGLKLKGVMNVCDKTRVVLSSFVEGHTQYVADKEFGVRAGIGLGIALN